MKSLSFNFFPLFLHILNSWLCLLAICNICGSCVLQQFLQMMAGDEEEHAVLLANYFLYMKKITWLIIGKTFIRPIDLVEKITFKKKLFKHTFSHYRVTKVFLTFLITYIYIYDGIYIYIYKMMIWFLSSGKGIPEGPTAYVMTEQENDYWIWNAGTGEHFSYRDSYCPLQSISCLINAENVGLIINAKYMYQFTGFIINTK